MKMEIVEARLTYDEKDGYVGLVVFRVEGHPDPYEATLHSTKGRDWSYGLRFAETPGDELKIEAVEEWLEEDDDAFELLIDAARSKLAQ